MCKILKCTYGTPIGRRLLQCFPLCGRQVQILCKFGLLIPPCTLLKIIFLPFKKSSLLWCNVNDFKYYSSCKNKASVHSLQIEQIKYDLTTAIPTNILKRFSPWLHVCEQFDIYQNITWWYWIWQYLNVCGSQVERRALKIKGKD